MDICAECFWFVVSFCIPIGMQVGLPANHAGQGQITGIQFATESALRRLEEHSSGLIIQVHDVVTSKTIFGLPVASAMVEETEALITAWSWQRRNGLSDSSLKNEVIVRCDFLKCDKALAGTIRDIFQTVDGPEATSEMARNLERLVPDKIRRVPCGFQLRLCRETTPISIDDVSKLIELDRFKREFDSCAAACDTKLREGGRLSQDERNALGNAFWRYEMRRGVIKAVSEGAQR